MDFQKRKQLAIASILLGSILVIGGMLLFGQIAIHSWLHGSIIFLGFGITSFGTKQLRCSSCNKFPDLDTGECTHCNEDNKP